jgi:hypothetical protein
MSLINVNHGELIHSSQKEIQVITGDGSKISYTNLDDLPSLFDGNYNSLSNKPSLFDGNYSSLSGLPSLFDGNYSSLSGLPSLFDGNYSSLSNKPVLNKLSSYTVATAPTGTTGDMIMVSDSTPANAPAYFDGTDWKYMADNSTI